MPGTQNQFLAYNLLGIKNYLLQPQPKFVNKSKNIIIKNKISLLHPKKLLLLQHLSSVGVQLPLKLSVGICNPPFYFIYYSINFL